MVEPPEAPLPWLRTVALSVKGASAYRLPSLTLGDSTIRSGPAGTESVVAVATLDAGPMPAELMAETR